MVVGNRRTRLAKKSKRTNGKTISLKRQRQRCEVHVLELFLILAAVNQSNLDRFPQSKPIHFGKWKLRTLEWLSIEISSPHRVLNVRQIAEVMPMSRSLHPRCAMHVLVCRRIIRRQRWKVEILLIKKSATWVGRNVDARWLPAQIDRLLVEDLIRLLVCSQSIFGATATRCRR